ncbi:MAG: DUF2791 family P-loop domain-containing protein [Clostridia bacterium]|nr:DUF2791 family P-loop domain-containing protein [Clostridia bacterium]
MYDKEARRIIEALRSGVPSRTVGQYFTEARPMVMQQIGKAMDTVLETGKSNGSIIRGRYGEGKTHLLNTVFNMAHQNNMVVSMVSLGKEIPMHMMNVLYPHIVNNTYLPGHDQPGFLELLDRLTPNSPQANRLQLFATRELTCDKLYYVLKTYANTEDADIKTQLRYDLEGDFISTPTIKRMYKETTKETCRMNVSFSKTKHTVDYFHFLSEFFLTMGYEGWVILFDEAERIGFFTKKQRMSTYKNMMEFLTPPSSMKSTYSLFAFTASYIDEVIEKKQELANTEVLVPEDAEKARAALAAIGRSSALPSLTVQEIKDVVGRILTFHEKAYDWKSNVSVDALMQIVDASGFLLRTKLRATIEYLDQLYLYGTAAGMAVSDLEDLSLVGEEVPSLGMFDEEKDEG